MASLRLGDRGETVEELQRALAALGYPVAADGILGPQTDAVLRAYQAVSGLVEDGACGPDTRSALAIDQALRSLPGWGAYRGSLGVLVREESYAGDAHWPGGASGVTLDRGFDLRWQPEQRLRALYGHLWPASALEHLATACGLSGQGARLWLEHARVAGWAWLVSREQTDAITPHAALPYWQECLRVWPELERLPSAVNTAALSVCYSAWSVPLERARRSAEGAGDGLGTPLAAAAHVIRQAPGDPRRRAREAHLIESAVE